LCTERLLTINVYAFDPLGQIVAIPDKWMSGCGSCHKSVLLDESSPAAIVGNFLRKADCEMLPAGNKAAARAL